MAHRKKKVLVIEDNSGIRLSLEVALKSAGYDVASAEDGEAGLRKAASEKPDLVILDLFLPMVDGFKVLGQLHQDRATSKIPVVIFSVLSQEQDKMEAERLGAVGYLVKSESSIESVVQYIAKLLS
ncbi:MAG: hypothetical protein RL272_1094 [Candidatus Parcubacteria bacterium]|jgi:DNA-binding response OmpR family regulator